MTQTKGFTLIELIIVIALIALLATTVILVINPVRLFQEARDSQRIADLGQMNSAMSLYLATSQNPVDLDGTPGGTNTGCGGATPNCWTHQLAGGGSPAANCGGRNAGRTLVAGATQVTNGTGWVPVNLGDASGGSPIAAWPVDPRRTGTQFYSYACQTDNTYEFAADMESVRYAAGGADDVEGTDGGSRPNEFEVGTNVGL